VRLLSGDAVGPASSHLRPTLHVDPHTARQTTSTATLFGLASHGHDAVNASLRSSTGGYRSSIDAAPTGGGCTPRLVGSWPIPSRALPTWSNGCGANEDPVTARQAGIPCRRCKSHEPPFDSINLSTWTKTERDATSI
jgi:hypothetical protein